MTSQQQCRCGHDITEHNSHNGCNLQWPNPVRCECNHFHE